MHFQDARVHPSNNEPNANKHDGMGHARSGSACQWIHKEAHKCTSLSLPFCSDEAWHEQEENNRKEIQQDGNGMNLLRREHPKRSHGFDMKHPEQACLDPDTGDDEVSQGAGSAFHDAGIHGR